MDTNNLLIMKSLETVVKLAHKNKENKKVAENAEQILQNIKLKLNSQELSYINNLTNNMQGGYIPIDYYPFEAGKNFDPRMHNNSGTYEMVKFNNINTYFLGIVGMINKSKDFRLTNNYAQNIYTEFQYSLGGIEKRFPSIIQLLSARGNWKLLNKEEAFSINKIDYAVCNTNFIVSKANVSERVVMLNEYDELSNKGTFYKKFYNETSGNFIPPYIPFTRGNSILDDYNNSVWNIFRNQNVILKADKSFAGIGIKIMKLTEITFPFIKKHIYSKFLKNNESVIDQPDQINSETNPNYLSNDNIFEFDKWTLSKIIKSELYNPLNNSPYEQLYKRSLNDDTMWINPTKRGKYVNEEGNEENMPTWDNQKKNGFITRPRVYMLLVKNAGKLQLYYYQYLHIYSTPRGINYDLQEGRGSMNDKYAFIVNKDQDPIFMNNIFLKPEFKETNNYLLISNKDYYEQVWGGDQNKINLIHAQVQKICSKIFDEFSDIIVCKSEGDDKTCYHMLALDLIITNENNNPKVYITEINTSPLIKGYYTYPTPIDNVYPFPNAKGNSWQEIYIPDLLNEILYLSIDKKYRPHKYIHFTIDNTNNIKMSTRPNDFDNEIYPAVTSGNGGPNFLFIKEVNKQINNKLKFYVPAQTVEKYPFIYRALAKRNYIKPSKNAYIDIALFYGLRELYYTDQYSFTYYDEIINYLMSINMKNASVINKIQGITYYLASKDKLYYSLKESYDPSKYSFHPQTIIFIYDGNKNKLVDYLKKQLADININDLLLKPVFGSQGKGIKRFGKNDINSMVSHIDNIFTMGIPRSPPLVGVDKYNYWMITQFLNNPWLYERNNEFLEGENITVNIKVKTNMRFYVLLVMEPLPTMKNLTEQHNQNLITAYICNKGVIYLAMENYDKESFKSEVIITNLQIAKNNYSKRGIQEDLAAKNYTYIFPKYYDMQPNKVVTSQNIFNQFKNMVETTIDATKYNLRCLNRFSNNYKGCFNLLAYDTQLDVNGKLWLIEINRGPDLAGIAYNLTRDDFTGQDAINNTNDNNWAVTNFFDDIFHLSMDTLSNNIDPNYTPRYFNIKVPLKFDPFDYNERTLTQRLESLAKEKSDLLNHISKLNTVEEEEKRTIMRLLQEHNIDINNISTFLKNNKKNNIIGDINKVINLLNQISYKDTQIYKKISPV